MYTSYPDLPPPAFLQGNSRINPGYSFPQAQREFDFPLPQLLCSSDHYNPYSIQRDNNLPYHFASRIQKIYSPFQQKNCYKPPHLSSNNVYGSVFKGQCKGWKIKNCEDYPFRYGTKCSEKTLNQYKSNPDINNYVNHSQVLSPKSGKQMKKSTKSRLVDCQSYKDIKSHHTCSGTTNYDSQYRLHEQKIQNLPRRGYGCIKSRIGYLVQQDRPTVARKPGKMVFPQEQQESSSEMNN